MIAEMRSPARQVKRSSMSFILSQHLRRQLPRAFSCFSRLRKETSHTVVAIGIRYLLWSPAR